ncbi:MAG: hypothetical protein Q4F21_02040 [Lachnospiraceae bacterium]|nr:hypothetical protein [Lachnospiraceae bacterium]
MNSETIYVCNFGAIEKAYAEIVNYIEDKRFGLIQHINVKKWELENLYQISDKNVCIMILTESAVSDSTLNKILIKMWDYMNNEHIPVLPISAGSQSYLEELPLGLSSLHILNLRDPHIIEKVCRFFLVHPSFSSIKSDIGYVMSCWGKESISSCTLGQLFNYALGLLYGIEVKQDLEKAFELLNCLIGNDAFEPDLIYFKADRDIFTEIVGKIFDFSNELKKYLDFQISNIVTTQDYRQAEELIDYANLMKRVGERLYGWNIDDSLRKLSDVILQLYEKDNSLKVGRWLVNYYWERALREADNRYYDKSLDCIFEIILIGENIEQKYSDQIVQKVLFKCYSILNHYWEENKRTIIKLIRYKITDEIEEDGTFRPPYRKIKRDIRESALLHHLFMNSKKQYIHKIDEIFENIGDDLQLYDGMLSEFLDAGYMSILFKVAVLTTYSEWFIFTSEYMRNKINDFSIKYQLKLLKTTSDFLEMLQHKYNIKTNLENLFKIAEYMEGIFDMNQNSFIEMGLDKSEIYVIYMNYYSEKKQLEKYDDYAVKLYKIVAKRDHENLEIIKKLLVDIYNVAVERLKTNMRFQMLRYIALGWEICQTFDPVPNYLDEVYDAFRSAALELKVI